MATLGTVDRQSGDRARDAFEAAFGARPASLARAPGRVNLIGEHTDYNGGLVLPAAIERGTRVALRPRPDGRVRGISPQHGVLEADFAAPPAGDWLDYPRGMARVLAEAGLVPARGFCLSTSSDLPIGAGLSSSAALLAATALALLDVAAADAPERPALARLCQRAEVEFAGVPCGLMDPYAVLCTREGAALLLDCKSGATRAVPLPGGVELLICDTGVARELRSGKYAERRAECERALELARAQLGRPLASLSEIELEEIPRLAALPALELRRARHVVSENARVRAFAAALEGGDRAAAGAALFASHDSLRADYEVTCAELDALVEDSRGVSGCLGARMTGAGFGGCTIHLVEAGRAPDVAARLGARFRARFGRTPPAFATRAAAPAALEMG